MAEVVQRKTEEMINEIEQMERIGLFTTTEVRAIIRRRKEFEYRIKRLVKTKDDFLLYIQYEMSLLALIKKRRKRLHQHDNKDDIEQCIKQRVERMFHFTCLKYQADVKLWLSYIQFLKKQHYNTSVSRTFVRMLAVHNNKVDLWISAAKWEMESNKSPNNARGLLLRALRFHPNNIDLYVEYLRFELLYIELLTYRQDVMDVELTQRDAILSGELADAVYNTAVEQINYSPQLLVAALTTARKFNFTAKLQQKIITDMKDKCVGSELMWDALARIELEAKEGSFKQKLKRCMELYEKAVCEVNTGSMWSYYIDTLLCLHKETQKLHTYCLQVIQRCHTQGKLHSQHYIQWVELSSSSGDSAAAVSACKEGLLKHPSCVELHEFHISSCITTSEDVAEVKQALLEALQHSSVSSSVWEKVLHWYKAHHPASVEELFSEAITMKCDGVTTLYLTWLTKEKGIAAGRAIYKSHSLTPPYSLELHMRMSSLEVEEERVNMSHVRRCMEYSIQQFGKQHTELWLQYMEYEVAYGDPLISSSIYQRAVKTLQPALVDQFITQATLKKLQT